MQAVSLLPTQSQSPLTLHTTRELKRHLRILLRPQQHALLLERNPQPNPLLHPARPPPQPRERNNSHSLRPPRPHRTTRPRQHNLHHRINHLPRRQALFDQVEHYGPRLHRTRHHRRWLQGPGVHDVLVPHKRHRHGARRNLRCQLDQFRRRELHFAGVDPDGGVSDCDGQECAGGGEEGYLVERRRDYGRGGVCCFILRGVGVGSEGVSNRVL